VRVLRVLGIGWLVHFKTVSANHSRYPEHESRRLGTLETA
jgi:hypothetical protein